MLQQILAIFLVLALLVIALWLLRRKGLASVNWSLARRHTGTKQMQVLERVALSGHHSLHLVRVRDRVILVGLSPSSCTRIEMFETSSNPIELTEQT
jgi:flagellar biosynthetic protein FliO